MEKLIAEREKTKALGIKGLGLAIILLLALNTDGPNPGIHLQVSGLDLTIPPVYVIFVVGAMTSMALVGIVNFFVLNEFVRIGTDILIKRHSSANAVFVFLDGSSAWSLSNLPQFRFFSSSHAHKAQTCVTLLFFLIPIGLLLAFVYIRLIGATINSLQVGSTPFESIVLVTILLMLLFPIAQAVLLFIPFTFEKNLRYIRWLFLWRISKRKHPLVSTWLKGPAGG